MTFHLYEIICALLLGGGIGLLTGFFGAGGGFILTPALNIFLGLDMPLAIGTGAFQVCGASALTLCQRADRRLPGSRVALCAAIGIFPGTWAGTRLVVMLRSFGTVQNTAGRDIAVADTVLLGLFVLLLTGIAVFMFLDQWKNREETEQPGLLHKFRIPPLIRFRTVPAGPFSAPVLVLLGFGMGILSGLLGIGGGVIMLPVLIYLVGQQLEYATLTTTMLVFLSGLGSSFFHGMNGNLAWNLLLPLLLGGFAGTFAGVKLQKKTGGRKLKQAFLLVVAAALLLVLWKLAGQMSAPP